MRSKSNSKKNKKSHEIAKEAERFVALAEALGDAGFTLVHRTNDDHFWMLPMSGAPKGCVIVEEELPEDHDVDFSLGIRDEHHLFTGFVLREIGPVSQIVAYFCRRAAERRAEQNQA